MDIIVSDRCYLSEIMVLDKEDLIHWLKDRWVYETTLQIPFPYTEEHATKFIESKRDSKYDFAIRNHAGILIGCIGIRVGMQPHAAILGYWLAKPYWGKGIMTEVATKFADFCFKEFSFTRLTASCFENNIGSARVLEKAGFKLEGLMIKHYKKDNVFYNGKLYGKVV